MGWRSAMLGAPLLLLLAAAGARAQEASGPVSELRNRFEYGEHERVIEAAGRILETEREQLSPSDMVEIYRYLGMAYYITGDRQDAANSFVVLLSLDPAYRLDPLYVPPEIVTFFDGIRAEASAHGTPAGPTLPTGASASGRPRSAAPLAIVFAPFGIGQFQNGQTLKGSLVLAGQLAAVAANVGFYFGLRALRGDDGRYAPGDTGRARAFRAAQYAAAGVAAGLWIYGVADAWYWRSRTPPPSVALSPVVDPAAGSVGGLLSIRY